MEERSSLTPAWLGVPLIPKIQRVSFRPNDSGSTHKLASFSPLLKAPDWDPHLLLSSFKRLLLCVVSATAFILYRDVSCQCQGHEAKATSPLGLFQSHLGTNNTQAVLQLRQSQGSQPGGQLLLSLLPTPPGLHKRACWEWGPMMEPLLLKTAVNMGHTL